MTSIERILAAAGGQPVDRRPFCLTLSLYGARLLGVDPKEIFTNPRTYAQGQLAVLDRFGPDLLLTPFTAAALALPFGAELAFPPGYAPNLKKPSQTDPAVCPFPEVSTDPIFEFLRETVRLIRAGAGPGTAIGAIVPGPAEYPALVMGLEAWIGVITEDPARAGVILQRFSQLGADLANSLLDCGATLVVVPLSVCSPSMVPPSLFRSLFRTPLETMIQGIRGPVVLHAGGVPFGSLVPDLAALPAAALFPDSGDSLDEVRLGAPGRLLVGGLNSLALAGRPPEAVYKEVKSLLESRAEDPFFMLGTAQADIPWAADPEAINAVRRAVQDAAEAKS